MVKVMVLAKSVGGEVESNSQSVGCRMIIIYLDWKDFKLSMMSSVKTAHCRMKKKKTHAEVPQAYWLRVDRSMLP
jgi:hypothetical protein